MKKVSSKRRGSTPRLHGQCPRAGHFVFCAWLCLIAAGTVWAQGPAKLVDFAGTWKAEFKKQTWLVLTLEPQKGGLTGTLTHSTYLSADNEGDLTSVGEEMATAKVEKAVVAGNTLRISCRDEEGDQDDFDLKVTGENTAELQPVSRDGAPVPKAFKLKRSVGAPQK